jgi:hypothetical protein
VTIEFNVGKITPRTVNQLKSKYEKLKQDAKTMAAADRGYSYGTGGGPYNPPTFLDRQLLEDIQNFIPLASDGLPPRSGGSDFVATKKGAFHRPSLQVASLLHLLISMYQYPRYHTPYLGMYSSDINQ